MSCSESDGISVTVFWFTYFDILWVGVSLMVYLLQSFTLPSLISYELEWVWWYICYSLLLHLLWYLMSCSESDGISVTVFCFTYFDILWVGVSLIVYMLQSFTSPTLISYELEWVWWYICYCLLLHLLCYLMSCSESDGISVTVFCFTYFDILWVVVSLMVYLLQSFASPSLISYELEWVWWYICYSLLLHLVWYLMSCSVSDGIESFASPTLISYELEWVWWYICYSLLLHLLWYLMSCSESDGISVTVFCFTYFDILWVGVSLIVYMLQSFTSPTLISYELEWVWWYICYCLLLHLLCYLMSCSESDGISVTVFCFTYFDILWVVVSLMVYLLQSFASPSLISYEL